MLRKLLTGRDCEKLATYYLDTRPLEPERVTRLTFHNDPVVVHNSLTTFLLSLQIPFLIVNCLENKLTDFSKNSNSPETTADLLITCALTVLAMFLNILVKAGKNAIDL